MVMLTSMFPIRLLPFSVHVTTSDISFTTLLAYKRGQCTSFVVQESGHLLMPNVREKFG